MKEIIRRFFTHNVPLKLLSLVFALGLWLFVSLGQTEGELPKRVPVEIMNMPESLIRTSDLVPELEVKISGPRNVLRTIDDNKLRYVLDLSGARPGTSNHRVYPPRIEGLPAGAKITELSPSQFDLTLSVRKKKTVRINPFFRGAPPEGVELLGRTVVPEFLEVSGAQEEVDILNQVDTEAIDLANKKESFSVRVGLDLVGRHIELVQAQDVQVNVYLGTPPVKNVYQGVRIEVRGTENRYRLGRDRLDIQLEGPPDQLIRLNPEDLVLVLDASKLTPGTHEAELKLELPEGMSVRNIELPHVQITVYPPGKKIVKPGAAGETPPTP